MDGSIASGEEGILKDNFFDTMNRMKQGPLMIRSLMRCGSLRFKTDLERLEFLFDLYRRYTDPLTRIAEKETRRAKRRRR